MLINRVNRATCCLLLVVHSVSPLIISDNSVLVSMIASGVFNSWPALVMNSFCRFSASMIGWIARLEKAIKTRVKRSRLTIPMAAAIFINSLADAMMTDSSKKMIETLPLDFLVSL